MTEKKPDITPRDNRGYQPSYTAPRVNPQNGHQPTTGGTGQTKPPTGGSSVTKK